MRTGFVVLLASLVGSLVGCRELGSYLSPEAVEACESGARTENCPTYLQPNATVTFQEPHVLTAEVPYAAPGLGRYLELRFRVESVLDIERVDLACAGLQLASWRPLERRLAVDLEATVDLLPCRAVSAAEPEGELELHTVPIEVRVLGPVGGQVVLDDFSVVVNLSDARVPDSRALIEVALHDTAAGSTAGGRAVTFSATSGEPDDPLAGPPEVWVDGVRVRDVIPTDDGKGGYLLQLPRGLSTRHTSGSSLGELLAPKLARLTFTGITRRGRNSVGRLTVEVKKDRREPSAEPELASLSFDGLQALPTTRPVAVPAPIGGESPGTLFLASTAHAERVHLFKADDTWEALANVGGGWVFAFTEQGGIVWQDLGEAWATPGFLQTDLSPGASPRPITLPLPAEPELAFRLGNGAVCIEALEPGSTSTCTEVPSTWQVQCLDANGALQTLDLTGLGGSREAPWSSLGLQDGWVSVQYGRPDCSSSQAVGGWKGDILTMNLTEEVASGLRGGDLTLLFSAGPERAVVGHLNMDRVAGLQLIDVAGGGRSLGHYFAPPASATLDPDDALLWADAEGGLVLLRASGVLERWLPGQATPGQVFDLNTWAAGSVRGIAPNDNLYLERLFERPRIVHGNGDVTAVFSLHGEEGPSLLILELDRDLTPVWAHVMPISIEMPGSFTAMPVGLPDGPYFDVAAWELVGQNTTAVFRWAR